MSNNLYKLVKENKKFSVFEMMSENTLGDFDNYDDANRLYRQMKEGKGFEGWTPEFLARKVAISFD